MSLIYLSTDTVLDHQVFDNIPRTVKIGLKLKYRKEKKDLNTISALEIQEAAEEFWKNYPHPHLICGVCHQETQLGRDIRIHSKKS